MASVLKGFSPLLISIICWLSIFSSAFAQSTDSTEIWFHQARELAFSDHYQEARGLCLQILDKNPMYLDAKVLFARTLAWEKQYDSSLVVLKKVIQTQYGHKDALYAICDVYTWKNDLVNAKKYADIGLSFHPGDSVLLEKNQRVANLETAVQEPVATQKDIVQKSSVNLDSLFSIARELAFNKKYKKARQACSEILSADKNYLDAYSLMARTFGWKQEFDTARSIIGKALTINPVYRDGLLTRVDIELWDGQYDLVIMLCDAALAIYPNDPEFIDRKQKALEAKKKIGITDSIQLQTDTLINSLLFEYYYDHFNLPYTRNFHMLSAGYGRKTKYGEASAKINLGRRISNGDPTSAVQLDLEAYPKITKSSYGYAAYAVSSGTIFPKHRIGLEYFQGLIWGTEVSIGFRYLDWNSNILVYTGSISKYIFKNWLCFRPYFTTKQQLFSNAYMFTYRRYFNKPGYAFISLLTGNSPDQPLFLIERDGTYNSNKVTAGFFKTLSPRYYGGISLGYQYEEYLVEKYRNRYDLLLSLKYKF